MQTKNIVKRLDEMTDDELLDKLRTVRSNREVVRAASKKRIERADTKEARKVSKKMSTLFGSLSDEERQKLIEQLSKE